jgi:hypothetical protein
MVNVLTQIRTLLTGSATLIALVPATRMLPNWLTETTTLPCICYRETNNFLQDSDYYDNTPQSETSSVQFDIFQNANTSTQAIALALDTVMIGAEWNRESSGVILDDTGRQHHVLSYSKRLYV